MSPGLTPSQTVGPFFSIGLPWDEGPFVVPEGTPDAFWIRGAVIDGAGATVPDALVETWQADPDGRFPEGWRGLGRAGTDAQGPWAIHTVMPGRLPAVEDGLQAPHLNVSVLGRGLLCRLVTRIYFEDADNAGDPLLARVPAARRDTLLARRTDDGYRFDIHLQGPRETVFLAV